jgi:hypothetical protein
VRLWNIQGFFNISLEIARNLWSSPDGNISLIFQHLSDFAETMTFRSKAFHRSPQSLPKNIDFESIENLKLIDSQAVQMKMLGKALWGKFPRNLKPISQNQKQLILNKKTLQVVENKQNFWNSRSIFLKIFNG